MTNRMSAMLAAVTATVAFTGLPAIPVLTDISSAAASAHPSGGPSFGLCVAHEETTEHDGHEAVLDCSGG
jgi:hypothetical protein